MEICRVKRCFREIGFKIGCKSDKKCIGVKNALVMQCISGMKCLVSKNCAGDTIHKRYEVYSETKPHKRCISSTIKHFKGTAALSQYISLPKPLDSKIQKTRQKKIMFFYLVNPITSITQRSGKSFSSDRYIGRTVLLLVNQVKG